MKWNWFDHLFMFNSDGGEGEGESEGDDGEGAGESKGKKESKSGGEDKKSKLSHEEALEALRETRGEAARNRIEAKKFREELDGLRKGLAKALGIGGDDESDVKQLISEIKGLKSKLMTSERKEAFRVVAKNVGADPDLAWAFLMANGTLDDPEADVEKAIKKALKEKPALKATQAQATGDPNAGGGGEKPKDMNVFIRRGARG